MLCTEALKSIPRLEQMACGRFAQTVCKVYTGFIECVRELCTEVLGSTSTLRLDGGCAGALHDREGEKQGAMKGRRETLDRSLQKKISKHTQATTKEQGKRSTVENEDHGTHLSEDHNPSTSHVLEAVVAAPLGDNGRP